MNYNVPCVICGEDSTYDVTIKDYYVSDEEFKLYHCRNCDIRFFQKEVMKGNFEKYYPKEYYAHTRTHLIQSRREKIQSDSLRIQKGKKINFWSALRAKLLRRFMLVELPYINEGSILDVGCGTGKLLYTAKSIGFRCDGVEPSEGARRIARDICDNVYVDIQDVFRPSDGYDLIVFNQSLEHIPDPLGSVRTAVELLKDGGQIIIAVPNYDCNERSVFKQFWRHIDAPRHLWHFNPSSLSFLTGKTGLVTIKTKAKFWGVPKSSFRLAKVEKGIVAYYWMFQFLIRQFLSLLTNCKKDYGSFFSVYLKKPCQK